MTAWCTACPDWQDRLRAGASLVPALPLDVEMADLAVGFFDMLRLPDVPGMPRLAEAGGDWFRDIIRAVFGSYDRVTGQRRIREVFALAPKKSSKTTYSAAAMLVGLLMNERPRAEFVLVAPTQEVAALALKQTIGMIRAEPDLLRRFHIQEHLKTITDRINGAFLKVKSFDARVMTGVKPAGLLVDELHVMSASPDADRVLGQARGGMVSQPEAFLIIISTQSERPPAGVFRAELMKARAVRDGRTVLPLLPVLYEFPAGHDWRDTSTWWQVTPNRGLSITIDRLVEEFEAAEAAGEEEVRRWASQHLNVEIGLALRSDRWAGADYWEAQAEPGLDLTEVLTRSEVVCIGIDGGGLDDLLALAVIGRERESRRWLIWCRAWAQPEALERRKLLVSQLRDFADQGDLTMVARLGEDIDQLADQVLVVEESGLLAMIGLDAMGVGKIVDALAERGIEGSEKVVAVSQGWQLSGSIKTLERKLADGTAVHCGQPILAWAVGNAKTEPRGNAITITKQAAGSAKIDPLMAVLDAVALMSRNPEAPEDMTAFFDDPVFI